MENRRVKPEGRKDFLDSPFRYPSNQLYALDNLLPLLPEHQSYIEPVCGSASLFFGKKKVGNNWLNDIDPELIETYKIIRDQPDKLIEFLKKEEISEERYNYFKKEFIPQDSFEVAARWFYLNQLSCLGTMSMFWSRNNKLKLRSPGWSKRILDCSKKLQGVKLTSGDFEEVISVVPEGAFLYLSPPYSIHHSSDQCRLHKYPFEKEDHLRLVDILKQNTSRIRFMLTYNENEETRRMYSWGKHITISNLPNKPPQKGEIVIINYKK